MMASAPDPPPPPLVSSALPTTPVPPLAPSPSSPSTLPPPPIPSALLPPPTLPPPPIPSALLPPPTLTPSTLPHPPHQAETPEDEARRLCESLINRLNRDSAVTCLCRYTQLTPVLQSGPMCGLVALCMAGQVTNQCSELLIPEVALQAARDRAFTTNGEMFSVKNLALLAETLLGCEAKVLSSNPHHLQESNPQNTNLQESNTQDPNLQKSNVPNSRLRDDIFNALLEGDILLVPYDKDGNNEPCCKKGHSAHWAVLSGFVLLVDAEALKDEAPLNGTLDEESPRIQFITNTKEHMDVKTADLSMTHQKIWHNQCESSGTDTSTGPSAEERGNMTPLLRNAQNESVNVSMTQRSRLCNTKTLKHLAAQGSDNVYVFAKQGKSRHTGLWCLDDLVRSCENLREVGEKIQSHVTDYIIPTGLQEGLAGQAIVLRKKNA